jgi:hypothetical protein
MFLHGDFSLRKKSAGADVAIRRIGSRLLCSVLCWGHRSAEGFLKCILDRRFSLLNDSSDCDGWSRDVILISFKGNLIVVSD